MNIELMNLFTKYMEKQEVLSRLTEDECLHGFSYSEIHTIVAIKMVEEPNVTGVAQFMKLTKGGITKITKKLEDKHLIESYKKETNKQKVFFKLTEEGQKLFDEHERRHNLYLKRDNEFFNRYNEKDLKSIEIFMNDFNNYLDLKIKEMEGEK